MRGCTGVRTVAVIVGALALLSGCSEFGEFSPSLPESTASPSVGAGTSAPVPATPVPGTPVPGAKSAPDAAPAPTPTLLGLGQDDASVIATLTSAQGDLTAGPFAWSTSRATVAADCVGAGSLLVEVVGVGSFPVECRTSDGGAPSSGSFGVGTVPELSLKVTPSDTALWAVRLRSED